MHSNRNIQFIKYEQRLLKNDNNLFFQKYMIEQKLQCYKKFEGQPANYFDCIEDIEAKMKSNAELLQQKYSQVEVQIFL